MTETELGKRAKPEQTSPGSGRWVLAATILGSSLVFIDGTVVNLALPALQEELQATAVEGLWIVESYLLFLAALMLVGGALGDRFGRRRIFSLGVVLFCAASIGCGLAISPLQLIVARAFQGVGGALLVPGSLAIISAFFGERQRGKAIGIWSGATGGALIVGPALGGYLIEVSSWRWVFFLNIPLGVAVLTITFLRVPESRNSRARRLDLWGALLTTGGLGGLTYGLIESVNLGFGDPAVLAALGGGIVALVTFFIVEARIKEPMLPLRLFKSRNFSGANAFTLLLYFALAGALFYLPFNFIQVQGYSESAAGVAMVAPLLTMMVLSRYTGSLADRLGSRLPMIAGSLLAAAAFALLSLPGIGGSYLTTFFPALLVMGLGFALAVPALTAMALSSAAESQAGLASGVNNAVARIAGLLALALFGLLMFSAFSAALDRRLEPSGLSFEMRQFMDSEKVKLAGAKAPSGADPALTAVIERAVKEAFVEAFRYVMLSAAILALLSAVAAALIIEGKPPEKVRGS